MASRNQPMRRQAHNHPTDPLNEPILRVSVKTRPQLNTVTEAVPEPVARVICGSIGMEIDTLYRNVSDLEELLGTLNERLRPIVAQGPAEGEAVAPLPPSVTQLGANIRVNAERVAAMVAGVHTLLDRLAIE